MTQRQQAALKVFRSYGFAKNGAPAIVGSLSGESGINLNSTLFRVNPDASGGRTGGDRSGGIAEWLNQTPGRGRKANMIAFAQSLNKPAEDLETQCLFVIQELAEYPGLNLDLREGTRSIETLTYNFTKFFERPNMSVAHLDDLRVPQAKKVLRDERILAAATPAVVLGGSGVVVSGGTAVAQGGSEAHIAAGVISALVSLAGLLAKAWINRSHSDMVAPSPSSSSSPSSSLPSETGVPMSSLDELKAVNVEIGKLQLRKAELKKNIQSEIDTLMVAVKDDEAAIPTGEIK